MVKFKLPIWVVRTNLVHPSLPPRAKCERILAFSATERIGRYLAHQGMGGVRVDRIENDQAVMFMVNDLYRAGHTELRINTEPDGSGGEVLSLATILDQILNCQYDSGCAARRPAA